jgi:hypothetical protein
MRRLALGCFLTLLGFLLGGCVGGVIGDRMDAATARQIEAEGDVADFLPVVTFLGACMGAWVGMLTALVVSLLVLLRSRATKPRMPSELK